MALDYSREYDPGKLIRDTRSTTTKVEDLLKKPVNTFMAMGFFIALGFTFYSAVEFFCLLAAVTALWSRSVIKKTGLPLRLPKTSGLLDPNDRHLKTGKPLPAGGIIYLGNDQDTHEEIWLTDTMARTHMLFMGTTGSGKAQPLDARVLTPSGWKRMGDLKVGDLVSTPDGKSAPIVGVFPQGKLDIYRVTFEDGRSTEACGDHLWEVHHKHWNGKYKPGVSRVGAARPRVLSTKDIIGLKARNTGKFAVRLSEPALMQHQDLPLHPYLLGALLGDGGLSGGNVRFSSDDEEVLTAVEAALPAGMTLNNYPACQHPRDHVLAGPRGRLAGGAYVHNPVRVELAKLGLCGALSEDKFVPEIYKNASAEQRKLLLQGLMDTDGYAGGSASFCSVSKQLAEDVQYLVRSLGGIASISAKATSYTHKGEKLAGKTAYIVNIRHPEPSGLFSLSRKSERMSEYQYADSLKLGIESIEHVGQKEAQCIMVDHPDHLYITDDFVVTHNTEFLISLVSNALIHGSGLIYVDGKADSSLYGKIYSMARSRGREDDVLVVNFQTGARDVFGAQPYKMSNTLNPFAVGSSGMLSQLVVSLMSTGKGDVWENRAISFVEALMKPLVFLRDRYGLMLDVSMIRDYFELPRLEELTWALSDTYPGLEETLDGMKVYLKNLPTYDRAKYQKQGETCNEQHGYITMQLVRTFNSLADTYGYIMRTQLAEIDFLDVFLNRRILVVLLPALEKSPAELTNLGRIIVASVKATMAVGLGARIEGDWNKVIEAKPTTSPSPFMCVLDEYGYYAVEGFAVVPAQARSLGFSAIFAGQDLPAFQKASEKEAESTLANTNTKLCGKMSCVKTYKYFSDLAGHGYYTRTGGYVGDDSNILGRAYKDGDNASIEKFERVTLDSLQKQKSGQWYLFFEGKIVRMKSFYADYTKSSGRNVSELRVNHFVRVARPSIQEVELNRKAADAFDQAIKGPNGLDGVLDTYPVREYMLLSEGFQMFGDKGLDPLALTLTAVAFGQREDGASDAPMENLVDLYRADRGDIGFDGGAVHSDETESGVDHAAPDAAGFDFAGGVQKLGGRTDGRRGARVRGTFDGGDIPSDDFPPDASTAADGVDGNDLPRYRDGVPEVPYGPHDNYGGEFDEERKRIFQEDSIEQLAGATVYGFSPEEGDEPPAISANDAAAGAPAQKARKVKPGLLNRDHTLSGLAAIQERLGDSRSEAAIAASVVAGSMSNATRYAQNRPTGPTSPESFIEIALRVSSAFGRLDEEVEEGQS